MPISSRKPSPLAAHIAAVPRRHGIDHPLWQGPCADGPLGGVTQSMLQRFIACRDRFKLKYVLGLEPQDKWVKTLGYGHMWHVCEEAYAGEMDWRVALMNYFHEQAARYPMQRDEIFKWFKVCQVQFPEYTKYWADHPDVLNRKPLMQEHIFDITYPLPSGREVRLRGKFDSVDLIDGGIYLQENKTKGDIDQIQVERQLKFDLQTMLYLVALRQYIGDGWFGAWQGGLCSEEDVKGVRYNVVRRPLSGGVGNIKPHAARYTKNTTKPAETEEEFYERLRRDYIANDPGYWFFRVRAEISEHDMQIFRFTCLDPLLEQLCWWYDEVTGKDLVKVQHDYGFPPMSYRTPFGLYNPLMENGSTEYDAFLDSGSEAGLRRVETLFPELQCV